VEGREKRSTLNKRGVEDADDNAAGRPDLLIGSDRRSEEKGEMRPVLPIALREDCRLFPGLLFPPILLNAGNAIAPNLGGAPIFQNSDDRPRIASLRG
jgi:hypothetical protein